MYLAVLTGAELVRDHVFVTSLSTLAGAPAGKMTGSGGLREPVCVTSSQGSLTPSGEKK